MTLFKTQDELTEVLPNTKMLMLEKLEPYFEEVADSVLAVHIGQTLYDRIQKKYTDDGEFSDPEKALLRRLRMITAKLALAAYLPIGEVHIGDDGITTVGKGEQRTAAYDQQITRLTESLTAQAYDSLERLLTWLQSPANLVEFPEYASSEAYIRQQRGLIRRAIDFSDIYPIAGSRLTFQAIHPELLNVEEDKLLPLIGSAQYNIIKGTGTLSDEYASLKRAAQKAVVFQAVANVIQLQQNIQLDAGGLRVYQTSQNGSQNVKYYRAPTEAERKSAAGAAQARADFFWDSVGTTSAEINNPGAGDYIREFLSNGKMAMF
ncbi:DUF6712 family protein [Dyadobacter jiangsuensis]